MWRGGGCESGLKGSYFPKSTGGIKIFVEIFFLFGSGFEKKT
jgi:hypothetical protein